MTPSEALQLLDNTVATIGLSRADHVKLQEAVRVLSQTIQKTSDELDTKDKK